MAVSSALVVSEDPAARGRTTITPEVVAKIAVRAAEEVDAVDAVRRSGLGRLLHGGAERVDVEVERRSTVIDLVISIRYPAPVATTAAQVRRHVQERVAALTGLEAAEVHLEIDRLTTPGPPTRRVE